MSPLRIADAASVLGLQQEIQRSDESRYDHRLHGVLLVAQGLTCPDVARLLGDAPRSVEYWVHRYEREGLSGLTEGERSGRPGRLNNKQIVEINRALRARPSDAGMREALHAYHDAVLRLAEVPGYGIDSAQQVIAEVGPAAAVFPSAEQLSSWVGTCPGREESAEVSRNNRSPKGNR